MPPGNAADADGTVARVDFYQGSTKVGTDASSPYSVSWTGVAAGTYSIVAVAVDNLGAPTTSSARNVTDCYIYDAVRTPRGRGKKDGALHEVTALELATQTLRAIRDRNHLDTAELDDVILGCGGHRCFS